MLNLLKFVLSNAIQIFVWPFHNLPIFWGLFFVSVLTGLMMLILFKYTSNQPGLRRVKNNLKAYLLEIVLYRDDVRLSLQTVKNLLGCNIRYLGFVFKPMLILAPVMFIVYIQLASLYDYRSLRIGEEVIITATCLAGTPLQDVLLEENRGYKIKTPPVRIPSENQISWKIAAQERGIWELTFRLFEQKTGKKLVVAETLVPIAAQRVAHNDPKTILFIAEPSLPAGIFLQNITIYYPKQSLKFFSWSLHWLYIFLPLSLAAGFSLKKKWNVQL